MVSERVQRVVLLVNSTAGRGRGAHAAEQAVPALRAAGLDLDVRYSLSGDHAATLARDAVRESPDVLAVVGGDGMVQIAAQYLVGSGTVLGVVPAGTGNDVARDLGIDPRDPLAAVQAIIGGRTRHLDLVHVAGRYVATVVASGFDSAVNERANAMSWPRGAARYNLATVAELAGFEPLHFNLELDGVRRQLEAMLVAVCNGPSFGGGLRICEGASTSDGLLDVAIIHPISRAGLVRAYPRLFRGTLDSHPAYERLQVRRISLAAPGVVAYGDGERIGPLPVTAEVVPGALRVLVPPTRG